MKDNYARCLDQVLRYEGGYSNVKEDPGGATMKGVTQRVYDAWRGKHGLSAQSVRLISPAEIEAIYRRDYWDRVRGDDLPPGVDLATFDLAVNSGVSRAVKMLQAVVRTPQDGIIGPATLAAVNANWRAVPGALCDMRLAFLQRLRTWPTFGRGWTSRVTDVRRRAAEMARDIPWSAAVSHPPPVSHEKTAWEEIEDFFNPDWAKAQPAPPPPPPKQEYPDDALHRYVVPAIVAFLGALSAQPWDNLLSDHPTVSISMILMAAVAAAWKAAAPWWAKAVWSPKVA